MFEPLARSSAYRALFSAQIIALLGTGLMTVALALLAFELAGGRAGSVLGTALAIKMVAYVGMAPLAGMLARRVNRKVLMIGADIVRACTVLALPFVDQIWQIYLLVFVLQSASAIFTPTFQAAIPDILPDEEDYTKALVLSRLAYDLESLISPMIAAALLSLIGFHFLFLGTALGFTASALLVAGTKVPAVPPDHHGGLGNYWAGLQLFALTPRLRGLAALNLAIASAGSMVLVNTVVYVQAALGGSERQTAVAFALFGAGSMIAALDTPRLLKRLTDRALMLAGAAIMAVALFAGVGLPGFGGLLVLWFAIGLGYGLAITPTGRLLRRSTGEDDRPTLFAAQFALSHLCWLVTYPLAGWLGAAAGLPAGFLVMGSLAVAAGLAAWLLWPAGEPLELEHEHTDLPPGHPHLAGAHRSGHGFRHAHVFVIDHLHHRWPR